MRFDGCSQRFSPFLRKNYWRCQTRTERKPACCRCLFLPPPRRTMHNVVPHFSAAALPPLAPSDRNRSPGLHESCTIAPAPQPIFATASLCQAAPASCSPHATLPASSALTSSGRHGPCAHQTMLLWRMLPHNSFSGNYPLTCASPPQSLQVPVLFLCCIFFIFEQKILNVAI